MKLIFHSETHKLLGVHIIGEGASELIHIGQAVLSFGGTVDYFVNTVFNYPTLAECYKIAAFDGINRLADVPRGTGDGIWRADAGRRRRLEQFWLRWKRSRRSLPGESRDPLLPFWCGGRVGPGFRREAQC